MKTTNQKACELLILCSVSSTPLIRAVSSDTLLIWTAMIPMSKSMPAISNPVIRYYFFIRGDVSFLIDMDRFWLLGWPY